MPSINAVTENIITLGKNNNWFIPVILLDYSDYVYNDSINTIYIKTSGLDMFMHQDNEFSNDELVKLLLEVINAKIPESNDYNIDVHVSDSFLDFRATY